MDKVGWGGDRRKDVDLEELERLEPLLLAGLRLDPRGGFLGQADVERAVDALAEDLQAHRSTLRPHVRPCSLSPSRRA